MLELGQVVSGQSETLGEAAQGDEIHAAFCCVGSDFGELVGERSRG